MRVRRCHLRWHDPIKQLQLILYNITSFCITYYVINITVKTSFYSFPVKYSYPVIIFFRLTYRSDSLRKRKNFPSFNREEDLTSYSSIGHRMNNNKLPDPPQNLKI